MLRFTSNIYKASVHLQRAVPFTKTKRGSDKEKLRTQYQLFYHLGTVHACEFIQMVCFLLIDCEMNEAIFGLARRWANAGSNHSDANVIKSVVNRFQVDKIFKERYAKDNTYQRQEKTDSVPSRRIGTRLSSSAQAMRESPSVRRTGATTQTGRS